MTQYGPSLPPKPLLSVHVDTDACSLQLGIRNFFTGKLVKIGAKVVRHGRYVTFHLVKLLYRVALLCRSWV